MNSSKRSLSTVGKTTVQALGQLVRLAEYITVIHTSPMNCEKQFREAELCRRRLQSGAVYSPFAQNIRFLK